MRRLLHRGLCLALGLSAMPVAAQELNFRAVASRPPVPQQVQATSEIPLMLSRPTPIATTVIFRAKQEHDGGIIVPADPVQPAGLRFAQKDLGRPSPLPSGAPADFPPSPTLISPPPSSTTIIQQTPGTVYSGPMNSGQIVNSPMSGPVMSGPMSSGQVITGDIVSGGCACNSGGNGIFGVFDGMIAEDPMGSCCGNSCSTCGPRWQPLQGLHDLFSCGCNTGCCDPRTALWIRGEYLLYNITQQNVPPLVTQFAGGAGNFQNLPIGSGSTVIYNNNNINDAIQNGGRITLGFWFPRHSDWGMDASYFYIGNRTGDYNASSDGSVALGRPFINNDPANPLFNKNDAEIVAATNLDGTRVPGSINISSSTQLWGVEANLRRKLCCGPGYWIDGLVGFRHLQLQDYVNITESIGLRDNGAGARAGSTVVNDSFGTSNVFNGGQLGLEAEWRFRPRLTLGGFVKVAAGNMHQTVTINGSTTINNGVFNGRSFASQTQQGGLLAQGTNIGTQSVDRFVVIPEFGVRLGWDITNHWRFIAGYNVLYLSNVLRAGEQIDTRVNVSQNAFAGPNGTRGTLTPGSPATPAVLMRTNEFWAQGVSLGLEYRY